MYRVLVAKYIAQKANKLQQNYTEVQMRQIAPGVAVSFKSETPTPGDSDSTSLLKTRQDIWI